MIRRKSLRNARRIKGNARRIKIERLETRCLLSADSFFPRFAVDDLGDGFEEREDQRNGRQRRSDLESDEIRLFDRGIEADFDRDDSRRGNGSDRRGPAQSRRLNEFVTLGRGNHGFHAHRHQREEVEGSHGSLDSDHFFEHDGFDQIADADDYFEVSHFDEHSVDSFFSAERFDPDPVIETPRRISLTFVFRSLPATSELTSSSSPSNSVENGSSRPAALPASQRLTASPATDLEATESNTENTTLDAAAAVAMLNVEPRGSEATVLVSATSNVDPLDSSVAVGASGPWWSSNTSPFTASIFERTQSDDTEMGRWLDRAHGLHDKFAELDNLLDKISAERAHDAISIEQLPIGDATDGSEQPPLLQNRWLHSSEGLILLTPGTRAGSEIASGAIAELDHVAAAGWTVGIGFFRAFEGVAEDSFSAAIVAPGQPVSAAPVNSRAGLRSGENDWRDEFEWDAFSSHSGNGALGFLVGCAGVYYLRNRKQHRVGVDLQSSQRRDA